jgi:hypothetical protein
MEDEVFREIPSLRIKLAEIQTEVLDFSLNDLLLAMQPDLR